MLGLALIHWRKAHHLSRGSGRVYVLGLVLGVVGVLAIGGCMSIEQMAPPVEGSLVEMGQEQGFETAHLQRGRQLYITNCAKCHTVEPIDRYSPKRWAKIIEQMAGESKLTARDTRKLHAYITVAGRFMSRPKADGNGAGE